MTTADPQQAAGYPPPGGAPGGFGGPPGGFGGPPGGAPPGGFGGPPPGGFGGPPGGAPPGGFGGPPGGAPPGGFGGPPPGGFGGPPGGAPPGGYGGPPPGGFGGPPQGGFGGAPPPKKGSNLGLFIGLGCGGLLIVGIIIAVVVMFAIRDKPRTTSSSSTPITTGESDDSTPDDSTPSKGAGDVKLDDVRFFTGKGTSTILHMVAEIRNSGSGSVGFPQAKVTLYDAANTAVSSSYCTSVVRILPGNENIPCYAIFSDVKSWKTWKAEVTSSTPFGRLADVKASNIEYNAPKRSWEPHTLTGKITNSGSTGAKSVWAIVGLYDKDGKIAGVGSAPVAGNDLTAGASGNFKVSVYSVAAPVTRYVVTPVGYE